MNSGKIKKPQIMLPINFFTVDCGECKGRLYEVKILPQENRGRIMCLVCANCRNTLNVGKDSFIEGEGVISFEDPTQGVEGNGGAKRRPAFGANEG